MSKQNFRVIFVKVSVRDDTNVIKFSLSIYDDTFYQANSRLPQLAYYRFH